MFFAHELNLIPSIREISCWFILAIIYLNINGFVAQRFEMQSAPN